MLSLDPILNLFIGLALTFGSFSLLTGTIVEALASAHSTGTVVDGAAWGDALSDAEQAYWVQDGVGRALGVFGSGVPQHWKSGGPSRTATLTHAPLPPAGVRTGPARFADMGFHIPGFEAEIAGFDEAARALFAGDIGRFEEHSATWPDDVREHAALLAADAFAH